MKLVACQLDVGGLIWVNPDLVTSVQRQGPGVVLIRFAAGQPQQVIQVKGEPQDVVQRLMGGPEMAGFDRREGGPPLPEDAPSLGLGDPAPALEVPRRRFGDG